MIRFNITRLPKSRLGKTAYVVVGMLPAFDGQNEVLRLGIMVTLLTRCVSVWWGK